ncbi:MAG: TrkA domain protein [Verrucomicrobiales bacterium]|jgi:TrkA domain protein
MTEVRETKLPGVGVRHEFTTREGKDMAVVVHHDGRRELMTYEIEDPDCCTSLLTLSEHDTQTLAEILGVSHVAETVGEIRQDFDAVAIEWVELEETSALAHAAIGSAHLRTETGASIVAVIRNDSPIPSPGPDFVLEAGDVVVAVGEQESLTAIRSLLGPKV